ncbi:MAG: hypothetical protein V7603_5706 [Micromonosporaceae bacterium]
MVVLRLTAVNEGAGRGIPPGARVGSLSAVTGPESGLRSTGAVLGRAALLLVRHWPVLLALSFAGLAARGLLLIAAVWVSKANGVLGFLVMVLVPITTLTALVLMLRTVRSSLPRSSAAAGSGLSLLDHLGSVLVPFLAVYASYGYLKDDATQYFYQVLQAEVFSNAKTFTNPSQVDVAARLPFRITAVLIGVVVAAALLRWGLGRWKGAARRPWLGIIGAYLEVIWITLAAAMLLNRAKDWLTGRQAVRWVQDGVNGTMDHLGLFSHAAHSGTSWLGGLVGDAGTVIVVPVAWLTVGAVVYGHPIAPAPVSAHELFQRAARHWFRLPGPVRKVVAGGSASLRDRFGPLVHGLRLLARTGLRPMLLFCLAFLVVQSASEWLWEVERLLIGPRDLNSVWMPLSGPLSVVNDAIRTTLLVCLLGAAVEQVLRAQAARQRPADDPDNFGVRPQQGATAAGTAVGRDGGHALVAGRIGAGPATRST